MGKFILDKPGTAFDRQLANITHLYQIMATSYAVRNFRNALLALLTIGLLTTSCKKSGGSDNVDPRDQYVGVYDGGYQASTLVNNSLETSRETGTMQITVSKAQPANQLYIELLFNNTTKQTVTAELSNATFTIIDKNSEPFVFDGKTYTANYTATGVFADKAIAINTTTETLQSGITLSKQISITGTLK